MGQGHELLTLGQRVVVLVFGLMLLGFGTALVCIGAGAIRDRHYEMGWNASGTFIGSQSGVAVYDGGEGVRVGVGMSAAGVMLGLWGVGVCVGAIGRRRSGRMTSPAVMVGVLPSAAALMTAATALFPPWRVLGGAAPSGFWGGVVVLSGIVAIGRRMPRWMSVWFPAYVAAIVVLSAVSVDASMGAALAVLGWLFGLGHLWVVRSGWRRWRRGGGAHGGAPLRGGR